MASPSAHVFIDVPPHPIAEPQPAIFPSILPTGPADPHFQATTTTNHREGAPAPLQPADYRDTEAQRGMLVCCFTD
jgi:hypothetical protein